MDVGNIKSGLESIQSAVQGAPYRQTVEALPSFAVGGTDALRAVLLQHHNTLVDFSLPGVEALVSHLAGAGGELIGLAGEPGEMNPLLAEAYDLIGQAGDNVQEVGSSVRVMDEALEEALHCLAGLDRALAAFRGARSKAAGQMQDGQTAGEAAAASIEEYRQQI